MLGTSCRLGRPQQLPRWDLTLRRCQKRLTFIPDLALTATIRQGPLAGLLILVGTADRSVARIPSRRAWLRQAVVSASRQEAETAVPASQQEVAAAPASQQEVAAAEAVAPASQQQVVAAAEAVAPASQQQVVAAPPSQQEVEAVEEAPVAQQAAAVVAPVAQQEPASQVAPRGAVVLVSSAAVSGSRVALTKMAARAASSVPAGVPAVAGSVMGSVRRRATAAVLASARQSMAAVAARCRWDLTTGLGRPSYRPAGVRLVSRLRAEELQVQGTARRRRLAETAVAAPVACG